MSNFFLGSQSDGLSPNVFEFEVKFQMEIGVNRDALDEHLAFFDRSVKSDGVARADGSPGKPQPRRDDSPQTPV